MTPSDGVLQPGRWVLSQAERTGTSASWTGSGFNWSPQNWLMCSPGSSRVLYEVLQSFRVSARGGTGRECRSSLGALSDAILGCGVRC